MIKPVRIEPPMVDLYNPEGKWLGTVNEYEFHEFRVQIYKNKAEGYYFQYEGVDTSIDKNGRFKSPKNYPFKMITNFMMEMF